MYMQGPMPSTRLAAPAPAGQTRNYTDSQPTSSPNVISQHSWAARMGNSRPVHTSTEGEPLPEPEKVDVDQGEPLVPEELECFSPLESRTTPPQGMIVLLASRW